MSLPNSPNLVGFETCSNEETQQPTQPSSSMSSTGEPPEPKKPCLPDMNPTTSRTGDEIVPAHTDPAFDVSNYSELSKLLDASMPHDFPDFMDLSAGFAKFSSFLESSSSFGM